MMELIVLFLLWIGIAALIGKYVTPKNESLSWSTYILILFFGILGAILVMLKNIYDRLKDRSGNDKMLLS